MVICILLSLRSSVFLRAQHFSATIRATPNAVVIIGVIRQAPTIGTLIALLLSILALLFWLVLGKPFGAKIPTGLK